MSIKRVEKFFIYGFENLMYFFRLRILMYWDYILNKNFHHLLAVNKIEVSAALHGKTNVNKQIYKDKSYRRVFFF